MVRRVFRRRVRLRRRESPTMTICMMPLEERRSDIVTERPRTVRSTCPLSGNRLRQPRSRQRRAPNRARTYVGVAQESILPGVFAVVREVTPAADHTTILVVDTIVTQVFLSNKSILSLPNTLNHVFGHFLILFKR